MTTRNHMAEAEILQGVHTQTQRVGVEILATLVGGTLLICSVAARFLFDHAFYPSALGFVAAILLGAPLVWLALRDLLRGHTHMNELVALAVLAAFAMGSYQEAGAIAFFMIISELIESRTALGAAASIESLIRISPTRARLLSGDQETEVSAHDLKPADVVRVRPGDLIPGDGCVVRGASTVNQARITGESVPAEVAEGDEVFAGTINLTGVMDIRVTKVGHDSTLGRVKDLILQAERTRAPFMRLIDRYASWYTPTILMLVAIVWFFSLKHGVQDPWERAIAMLVVACPCALILATPTAMVAALSAAARLGVLIKSVTDLESARHLTAMVFDKTGTLTTGQLRVTRLAPASGVEGAELLGAAATVEQHSRHPVARAVTEVAREARLNMLDVTGFHETPGHGVRGQVNGENILVGQANWVVKDCRDGLSDKSRSVILATQDSQEAQGLSLLFVVRGGCLLGWIGLEDRTRPQAASAIDRLRGLGFKSLIIVTGDRESVAKRVAEQMHTDYRAQVLPQEKLRIVDQLKSQGHRVAVVGDGVNDAPALAAGDTSIAMGAAGSDVAIHSAKIALMNNNLNRIPFLIELSHHTGAVVRQNMTLGVGFIVVFLSLSAAGYVTPVVAAVLHVLTGLVVVFNSARLVRSGEQIEHEEAGLSSGPGVPGVPGAGADDAGGGRVAVA